MDEEKKFVGYVRYYRQWVLRVLKEILLEIEKNKKEHLYKIFGCSDTYDDKYNEGWQDYLDCI